MRFRFKDFTFDFTQADVDRHSSQFNDGKGTPEFGSPDWREAFVDLIFEHPNVDGEAIFNDPDWQKADPMSCIYSSGETQPEDVWTAKVEAAHSFNMLDRVGLDGLDVVVGTLEALASFIEARVGKENLKAELLMVANRLRDMG